MKIHALCGITFAALVACGCSNDKTADPAVKDVQAAWDEFKTASLINQGNTAANRVTKATHDHYDEIRKQALGATREEIKDLALPQQIAVLGMRVRIESDRLKEMSGRDLFVHAVDKGWIGKNNVTEEGITDIVVTGDHARGTATVSGKPVNQFHHFIKEDGQWRLDMMQMMKFANIAMDAMKQKAGLDDEEFVTRIIETVTSKRLSADDWEPRK